MKELYCPLLLRFRRSFLALLFPQLFAAGTLVFLDKLIRHGIYNRELLRCPRMRFLCVNTHEHQRKQREARDNRGEGFVHRIPPFLFLQWPGSKIERLSIFCSAVVLHLACTAGRSPRPTFLLIRPELAENWQNCQIGDFWQFPTISGLTILSKLMLVCVESFICALSLLVCFLYFSSHQRLF